MPARNSGNGCQVTDAGHPLQRTWQDGGMGHKYVTGMSQGGARLKPQSVARRRHVWTKREGAGPRVAV